MRRHMVFVVGLLACLGSPAVAQTTRIEHQGVACAVAERFPRFEAGVSPVESVAMARVLFQGTSSEWYSVAMKAQGGSFIGVLPKPKKGLPSFRYYIEVTDKALRTTRTPEFTTTVIESSGACKGGILAGALGSASVVLQGPAGVVALPAGFASTGVVAGSAAGSTAGASGAAAAGGGGLSTGAVVGIVGGVAAAGAGVAAAVALRGDGGTLLYQGPFAGQAPFAMAYTDGTVPGSVCPSGPPCVIPFPCSGTSSVAGTVQITLDHESGAVNGRLQTDGTSTSSGTGSCAQGNLSVGGSPVPLTGTAGSFTGRLEASLNSTGAATITTNSITEFSGALSGGAITGTLTLTRSVMAIDGFGRASAGEASVAMPVTLTRR